MKFSGDLCSCLCNMIDSLPMPWILLLLFSSQLYLNLVTHFVDDIDCEYTLSYSFCLILYEFYRYCLPYLESTILMRTIMKINDIDLFIVWMKNIQYFTIKNQLNTIIDISFWGNSLITWELKNFSICS